MTIAEFYFYRRSNFRAARVFYNEAITAFPDSAVAERARAELAKIDAAEAERAARAEQSGGATRKKFLGLF